MSEQYKMLLLPIEKVKENEMNSYDCKNIDELAGNILSCGRLIEPLSVLGPDSDGCYTLIAGHRRRMAFYEILERQAKIRKKIEHGESITDIEENTLEFDASVVPCVISDNADLDSLVQKHYIDSANIMPRDMDDEDKNAHRLDQVETVMKLAQDGNENHRIMAKQAAAYMQTTERYQRVYAQVAAKADDSVKEALKANLLRANEASKVSSLPAPVQKELMQQIVEEDKKWKDVDQDYQKASIVMSSSDTDTKENLSQGNISISEAYDSASESIFADTHPSVKECFEAGYITAVDVNKVKLLHISVQKMLMDELQKEKKWSAVSLNCRLAHRVFKIGIERFCNALIEGKVGIRQAYDLIFEKGDPRVKLFYEDKKINAKDIKGLLSLHQSMQHEIMDALEKEIKWINVMQLYQEACEVSKAGNTVALAWLAHGKISIHDAYERLIIDKDIEASALSDDEILKEDPFAEILWENTYEEQTFTAETEEDKTADVVENVDENQFSNHNDFAASSDDMEAPELSDPSGSLHGSEIQECSSNSLHNDFETVYQDESDLEYEQNVTHVEQEDSHHHAEIKEEENEKAASQQNIRKFDRQSILRASGISSGFMDSEFLDDASDDETSLFQSDKRGTQAISIAGSRSDAQANYFDNSGSTKSSKDAEAVIRFCNRLMEAGYVDDEDMLAFEKCREMVEMLS